MKFKIEVDCTPEELRETLGVPNTEEVMKRITSPMKNMTKNTPKFNPFDPFGLLGKE